MLHLVVDCAGVLVLWGGSCSPLYFSNHIADEKKAGCFNLVLLWLSEFTVVFLKCRG